MEALDNTDFEKASGSLRQERLNRYRKAHGIGVRGNKIPEPWRHFDDVIPEEGGGGGGGASRGLHPALLRGLTGLGVSEPTPVQSQAMPLMMARRELLVCAPTGSGKTLAFLLPVLTHSLQLISSTSSTSKSSISSTSSKSSTAAPLALILTPTVELAAQIRAVARQLLKKESSSCPPLGVMLAPTCNEGRLPKAKKRLAGACHVIASTPKRILDAMAAGLLSCDRLQWLVLDEADRLLDSELGCGFRQQLSRLLDACRGPQLRRALFSATTRPAVQEWGRQELANPISLRVGHRNAAASAVTQSLTYCGSESGKLHEVRMLLVRGLQFPCMIFLQSRDRARLLCEEIASKGVKVGLLCGDLNQKQREQVMDKFREQELHVLVCTDITSRGIDVPELRMVVNYDLPPSPLEYVHRVGRTGRAGRRGQAITLWTDEDFEQLRPIAHLIREAGGSIPGELNEFLRKVGRKSGKKSRKLHLPQRGDLKGRGVRPSNFKKSKDGRAGQGAKKRKKN